jgi:hypothetical protein
MSYKSKLDGVRSLLEDYNLALGKRLGENPRHVDIECFVGSIVKAGGTNETLLKRLSYEEIVQCFEEALEIPDGLVNVPMVIVREIADIFRDKIQLEVVKKESDEDLIAEEIIDEDDETSEESTEKTYEEKTIAEAFPGAENLTFPKKVKFLKDVLFTREGRDIFANKIFTKTVRSIVTKGIARQLLLIDDLEDMDKYEDTGVSLQFPCTYPRDCASTAYVFHRRSTKPEVVETGEEVTVPTFMFAANPGCLVRHIEVGRIYLLERSIILGAEAIRKQEEQHVISALTCAAENRPNNLVIYKEYLTPELLAEGMGCLGQHDSVVHNICMHPVDFVKFVLRYPGRILPNSDDGKWNFDKTGHYCGRLEWANVWTSAWLGCGDVLFMASQDEVGVMPVRKEVSVTSIEINNKRFLFDSVLSEEVGIAVLNDYNVAMLRLRKISEKTKATPSKPRRTIKEKS